MMMLLFSSVSASALLSVIGGGGGGGAADLIFDSTRVPSNMTLSNGDTTATSNANGNMKYLVNDAPFEESVYFELTVPTEVGTNYIGFIEEADIGNYDLTFFNGENLSQAGCYISSSGTTRQRGSQVFFDTAYAVNSGDRLMFAFEYATGDIWFGKNGTWLDNPETEPAPVTFGGQFAVRFAVTLGSGTTVNIQNGADQLYTAPTGFTALGSSGGGTPSEPPATDPLVFALMGQSNMVGRHGPVDFLSLDAPDPDIRTYNFTSGGLETAADPLDHFDETSDTVGPGLSFAKAVKAATGRDVILIPAADGGTGFRANNWQRGNTLYNDALARLETGMAEAVLQFADAEFAGFLWAQGEDDVLDYNISGKQYGAYQRTFIWAIRNDFSAADQTTPFLMSGMPPDWVATQGTPGSETQAEIANTETLVGKTAYVDPTGLASESGDTIHFSAASARTLGDRFNTERATAAANVVAEPTFPTAPANAVFAMDYTGIADGIRLQDIADPNILFYHNGVYVEGGGLVFSGAQKLYYPYSQVPLLGSAPFTMNIVFNSALGAGLSGLMSQYETGAIDRSFLLRLSGSTMEFYISNTGSGAILALSHSLAGLANTDIEVEIVRTGDAFEMFVNGSSVDTYTASAGFSFWDTGDKEIQIGNYNGDRPFNGTIKSFSLVT